MVQADLNRPLVRWHFERDNDTGRRKVWDRDEDYGENGPLWEGHFEGEHRFAAFRHIRDGGWFFHDDFTETHYDVDSLQHARRLAQLIVDYEDPWIYAEDGLFSSSRRFYASSTPRKRASGGYCTYLRDFHTGRVYELCAYAPDIRAQALKILNSEASQVPIGSCFGGRNAYWLRQAILNRKTAPTLVVLQGGACQGT